MNAPNAAIGLKLWWRSLSTLDKSWSEWAQSKHVRNHYVLRGHPGDFWHRFRVKQTERLVHKKKHFCFVVWTPNDGALVIPATWFIQHVANKAVPDRIAGWVGGRKGSGWSFGVAGKNRDRLTIPAKTMERFVFRTPADAWSLLEDSGPLDTKYAPQPAAPDFSKELIAAARRASEVTLFHMANGIEREQRLREVKFALRRLHNEDRKAGRVPPSVRIENGPVGRLLKVWAGYRCQVVGCNVRTFTTREGVPYVEPHFLDELADPILAIPENVVILCAHHHRMLHLAPISAKHSEEAFYLNDRTRIEIRRFRFSEKRKTVARPEPSILSFTE